MIKKDLKQRIEKIKMLVFDVDGVLTDGTVYLGSDRIELKRFSIIDGAGFHLAQAGGLKTALISGRYSPATEERARELAIDAVYNGHINKLEPYFELKKKFNLNDEQIAYVGDDLIDIPIMELAGLPIAVNNAYPPVKNRAVYITEKSGGEGAVREVIDLVLEGQGRYESALTNLRTKRFGENIDQV